MSWFHSVSIEFRLGLWFAIGAMAGWLAHRAVERLKSRLVSPRELPGPEPAKRQKSKHPPAQPRASIRPWVVTLGTGALFAALYWWEVDRAGLLSGNPTHVLPPGTFFTARNVVEALHVMFIGHAVLIALMLAASLIDIEEKIIPDSITVPGTLFGLLLAAAYPWALLPNHVWLVSPLGQDEIWLRPPTQPFLVDFVTLASPGGWPASLAGFPQWMSLVAALGCWWLWCVGLLHRPWRTRRGWGTAVRLCLARVRRDAGTPPIFLLGLAGSLVAGAVWRWGSPPMWAGLLSSLVGMAAGGALVWVVRIVGGSMLQKEAMGFGDVTLMSMIGAFVGWQAALVIFFLAPVAGVFVAGLQWLLNREREIWFGPFLCLAALIVIVLWASIWPFFHDAFEFGWLVPGAVAVGIVLMALLLGLWRMIATAFERPER